MHAALRVCPKCLTEYDPPDARCTFDGESLQEVGHDREDETPPLGTPLLPATLGELGAYRLLSILGEGAMAVVYAAEHGKLGRRCAIKRLRPEHVVGQEALARFVAEARAIASIQHPNLVTIYDVVAEPGEAYLVMELLDGRDLQTVLQTGPLTVDRALGIAADVCDALTPVHGRGIVHRDLKPANVFLCIIGGREQVKLLDFGAARLLGRKARAAEERLQADGATLGSPVYMSPEQIAGEPLDPRSDLYAVGVVLYEMLAGAPPFSGETPSDVLLQHLNNAPRSLRSRGVAVSPAIDALVLRCLAKKREDRPESALALATELRQLLQPLASEPPPRSLPPQQPARTGRPWLVAAGSVVSLAALAAVALAVTGGRPQQVGASVVPAVPPSGAPATTASVAPAPSSIAPSPLPAATPPAVGAPSELPAAAAPPTAAVEPRGLGAAASRELRIETMPPAAVAAPEGGLPGCTTPCTVTLPDRATWVALAKPGFRDERVQVAPEQAVLRLTLVPQPPRDHRPRARGESAIPVSETLNPFQARP